MPDKLRHHLRRACQSPTLKKQDKEHRLSLRNGIKKHCNAWKTEERSHLYALIILLITGIALRVPFLFQPIMHDEAVNYTYYASLPLSHGLSYYLEPGNHLLNTFFIHLTTRLLGNEVWLIRIPALLAGILIIPATYLAIRKLFNKNAGIIAAVLVTTSSQLIAYSVNGRGFTMQALIFLLLIITAIQVKRTGSLAGWILFVLLSVSGFYAIPTMLYFFGAIALWLFFSAVCRDTPILRSVVIKKLVVACILTTAITALLYLPVFLKTGVGSVVSNRWVKPLGWSSFVRDFPGYMLTVWKAWTQSLPLVLSVILALGFIASIFFYKRISRHRVNLAIVAICWCVSLVFIMRVLPPTRVWLPLLPLFLGYASAGLYYLGTRVVKLLREKGSRIPHLTPAISLAILVVFSIFLGALVLINQSPYQPPDQVRLRDAEKITLFLKDTLKPGDIVYIEPNIRKHLEYYFYKYDIPIEYIYRYPEDSGKKYKPLERAFIIEAEKEGYTLDISLSFSNLDRTQPEVALHKLVEYPYASVFLINDPVLPEECTI